MFTPIKQGVQDGITELYLGFFGRAPDPAGLIFWSEQIQAGANLVQVADQFAQSPEFSRQYADLSVEQVVTKIYDHVLERAPDPGGLSFWTSALKNGTSLSSLVWTVVDSAFTQKGSPDALLVQGKIYQAEALVNPIIHQQGSVNWSVTTGFGEINAASALSTILATPIAQTNSYKTAVNQWGISTAHFQDAWAAGYTGKGVVIANLDSGLDLKNASLTQNLSAFNWNFLTNTSDVQDDNGHGSATASEMIAKGALVGAANDAQLMVLKVVDSQGVGTMANLAKAINYAVEHGADVINVPLGGLAADDALFVALSNANAHGVIVCMAAGNNSSAAPQFPAAYAQKLSNCIAVGASVLGSDSSSVSFLPSSNVAGSVDAYPFVEAPGSQIYAYGLNGQIKTWTGTSFATPLVSAEVAILLSANTGLAASEIVSAVIHTTVELIAAQPTVH